MWNESRITVSYLEQLNAIIDLCIDNEMYDELNSFLIVDLPDCRRRKTLPTFSTPRIDEDALLNLLSPHSIIVNKKGADLCPAESLETWKQLFWAKAIRAEIKKQNLDLYDDLLTFLEGKIPFLGKGEAKKTKDRDKIFTIINFLMELSALAHGEASHGYAERARAWLTPVFGRKKTRSRGFYERWIGYNKGMAYQHMKNRGREAVLEFNWIIEQFVAVHEQSPIVGEQYQDALEFLLNICPGTLQRAAISLKMQLSYHALQALVERHMDSLLTLAASPCRLFNRAAGQLLVRTNLYRLEALLQLETIAEAREKLSELYKELFGGKSWAGDLWILPSPSKDTSSGLKTQLIEHTVAWLLEDLRTSLSELEFDKPQSNKFGETISKAERVLWAVKTNYWKWIESNGWFDKRVYFSKWAQLLMVSAKTLADFLEFSDQNPLKAKKAVPKIQKILNATVALYLARKEYIPVSEARSRKARHAIEIENLRSDDLPDFLNGLSGFYRTMSKLVRSSSKALSASHVTRAFKGNSCHADPMDTLIDAHLTLLDAVDEWEVKFDQRRRISLLNRCNERLIWYGGSLRDNCKSCFENCLKSSEVVKRFSPLWTFKGLLPCAKDAAEAPTAKKGFIEDRLRDNDYEHIMDLTEKSLTRHLNVKSKHSPKWKALHFIGLQRWNSETPAQGRSVGGGYFIYRTDKSGRIDLGIAVDPGFDFIRNFFRMGFSLRDINIVLMSHAHPDHLWDFESIVHLLHELEDKKKILHRVHAILTLSGYRRLEHVITNPKLKRYVNPLIIDIRREIEKDYFENLGRIIDGAGGEHEAVKNCFRFVKCPKEADWKLSLPLGPRLVTGSDMVDILPTRAYHDDHTDISDSFGFLLYFRSPERSGDPFCFGYTGDSKWVGNDLYSKLCPAISSCVKKGDDCRWNGIADQYADCDAVLIHLGSLIDHKGKNKRFLDYDNPEICENLIRKKNHPYLMGMIRFLRELRDLSSKKKLILLGEFGEELRGGIRTDLAARLQAGITPGWPILPVDVGLDISLCDYDDSQIHGGVYSFKFQCIICDEYVPVDQIEYFRFGQDEGIFCVCTTCYKSTPQDVRYTKMRHLYEIGRELRS